MNRYLAINIVGKIGQPTVIKTSSFINKGCFVFDWTHIWVHQVMHTDGAVVIYHVVQMIKNGIRVPALIFFLLFCYAS